VGRWFALSLRIRHGVDYDAHTFRHSMGGVLAVVVALVVWR
jgi:hypothetical protein